MGRERREDGWKGRNFRENFRERTRRGTPSRTGPVRSASAYQFCTPLTQKSQTIRPNQNSFLVFVKQSSLEVDGVSNEDQVKRVAHVLGGEDEAGGEVAYDAGDGDRGLETLEISIIQK